MFLRKYNDVFGSMKNPYNKIYQFCLIFNAETTNICFTPRYIDIL